jgi:hypothetical protein
MCSLRSVLEKETSFVEILSFSFLRAFLFFCLCAQLADCPNEGEVIGVII